MPTGHWGNSLNESKTLFRNGNHIPDLKDDARVSYLETCTIDEEVLPLLIEQAEDSQNENEVIYKVKLFTTDDIIYNVSVVEDKMKVCNCPDFTWNNIAFEHMYLLKKYNRNIAIFVISTNLPTPEVFIDNTRTKQQQQQQQSTCQPKFQT
ncbi:hypothetical protein BDF21DRAFT_401671 [Thamnidium elegans]|nr:hypothetical protein BDF21DRAFT_401671 [Thamnidium elegans]